MYCGHKNVKRDSEGYVYVKCPIEGDFVQIEHFSGDLKFDESNPSTIEAINELLERCDYLSENNIKLSVMSVIWRKEAFDNVIDFLKMAKSIGTGDSNDHIVVAFLNKLTSGNTYNHMSLACLSNHLTKEDRTIFGVNDPIKVKLTIAPLDLDKILVNFEKTIYVSNDLDKVVESIMESHEFRAQFGIIKEILIQDSNMEFHILLNVNDYKTERCYSGITPREFLERLENNISVSIAQSITAEAA